MYGNHSIQDKYTVLRLIGSLSTKIFIFIKYSSDEFEKSGTLKEIDQPKK